MPFFQCRVLPFYQKIIWVYFWVFISSPLITLSLSMPITCSYYHYCFFLEGYNFFLYSLFTFQRYCFIVQFNIWDGDNYRCSFIFSIVLAILDFCFSTWSWKLFFQGLKIIVLGFWWEWLWICRFLLIRWSILLYSSYHTMSMGDPYIFLYLLQFLLSETWNFCYTGLSLSWLEL